MSEFEEKLNAILSSPEELEKISRLAAELMGGEVPPVSGPPPAEEGLPAGLLNMLRGAGGGRDKSALLQALSPYLRPERQQRLQKALRMAKLACLARAALGEDGG